MKWILYDEKDDHHHTTTMSKMKNKNPNLMMTDKNILHFIANKKRQKSKIKKEAISFTKAMPICFACIFIYYWLRTIRHTVKIFSHLFFGYYGQMVLSFFLVIFKVFIFFSFHKLELMSCVMKQQFFVSPQE